jgi:selenocysteine lyase/cysteine desulfurase
MSKSFTLEEINLHPIPYVLEVGTKNLEAIYGFSASFEFMKKYITKESFVNIVKIVDNLQEEIMKLDSFDVINYSYPNKVTMMVVSNKHSDEELRKLFDEAKIMVNIGNNSIQNAKEVFGHDT